MHVEFDATFDEAVDSQRRLYVRSPTYRRHRTLGRAFVGVCFGLALAGTIFGRMERPIHPGPFFLVAAAATVGGILFAYLYGVFTDRYALYYIRKRLQEMHGTQPFRCELEIRPQGLWAKAHDMEVVFGWPTLSGIVESPNGDVEFTFKSGLAVIRSRAFSSPNERDAFLAAARAAAATQAPSV